MVTVPEGTSGSESGAALLLIVRVGGQAFAVPAAAVERILPMAALTALPDAPAGVAGLLNVHGDILPVVDPRPRLLSAAPSVGTGTERTQPAPEQRLVLLAARTRYLLWVDEAERVFAPAGQAAQPAKGAAKGLTRGIVRLDDAVVPVLSPEALDPGPVAPLATAAAQRSAPEPSSESGRSPAIEMQGSTP
jgi:chemotaxis signal transduction protein